MKKIFITLLFLASNLIFANSSNILGLWITEKSSSGNQIIVNFYEKDKKYFGKIERLTMRYDENGDLKKDLNNPDKSKRELPLEGIDFVSNFNYNEENMKYENGFIYDPSTGKTYSCYMQIQDDGTLKVQGHVKGLTFLGKTQIWRRYK